MVKPHWANLPAEARGAAQRLPGLAKAPDALAIRPSENELVRLLPSKAASKHQENLVGHGQPLRSSRGLPELQDVLNISRTH